MNVELSEFTHAARYQFLIEQTSANCSDPYYSSACFLLASCPRLAELAAEIVSVSGIQWDKISRYGMDHTEWVLMETARNLFQCRDSEITPTDLALLPYPYQKDACLALLIRGEQIKVNLGTAETGGICFKFAWSGHEWKQLCEIIEC